MAIRNNTASRPGHPGAPARPLPEQSRRRVVLSPAQRIVRQIEAIDAWVTARRERELALQAPSMTRDERMDVARELEALRRTHDAIKGRCAHVLGTRTELPRWPSPTAVVAHRHAWFTDTLALHLRAHGVTVLSSTDNAAEALGVVVAEQPDVVLVGDCLAMMPVEALLADVRRFAPDALLALAAGDGRGADTWRARVDAVFLRRQSPSDVADALSALSSAAR